MRKAALTFILLTSCKSFINHKSETKKTEVSKEYTNCKIYNIDSISDYYLVYAIDAKARYKIISRKENTQLIEKIKINSNYNFELKAIINLDSVSHEYANYLDFKRCQVFFPSVEICNEPGIELYRTNNLVGLYYKK